MSARQFLIHSVSDKALFYLLGESELVTVVGTGLLFSGLFVFRCSAGMNKGTRVACLDFEGFLSIHAAEDFNTAVWCICFIHFKCSCSASSFLSLECGFDASDTF